MSISRCAILCASGIHTISQHVCNQKDRYDDEAEGVVLAEHLLKVLMCVEIAKDPTEVSVSGNFLIQPSSVNTDRSSSTGKDDCDCSDDDSDDSDNSSDSDDMSGKDSEKETDSDDSDSETPSKKKTGNNPSFTLVKASNISFRKKKDGKCFLQYLSRHRNKNTYKI